jgi:hypothetical protein
MKPRSLLLCIALTLPLPVVAGDPSTCAALHGEIETNLKQTALAEVLSMTVPDPASAASHAQSATANRQIVDRNLRMLESVGCPPYPGPADTAVYHGDALLCAYDLLKQRTNTTPCDQSAWTPKGRSETWHTLEGERSLPAPR